MGAKIGMRRSPFSEFSPVFMLFSIFTCMRTKAYYDLDTSDRLAASLNRLTTDPMCIKLEKMIPYHSVISQF